MNGMPEDEELLTMKETMGYFKIGRTKVYDLIREGKLKGHKVGCTWRFYKKDVRNVVKGGDSSVSVDSDESNNGQG